MQHHQPSCCGLTILRSCTPAGDSASHSPRRTPSNGRTASQTAELEQKKLAYVLTEVRSDSHTHRGVVSALLPRLALVVRVEPPPYLAVHVDLHVAGRCQFTCTTLVASARAETRMHTLLLSERYLQQFAGQVLGDGALLEARVGVVQRTVPIHAAGRPSLRVIRQGIIPGLKRSGRSRDCLLWTLLSHSPHLNICLIRLN